MSMITDKGRQTHHRGDKSLSREAIVEVASVSKSEVTEHDNNNDIMDDVTRL